MLNDERPDRFLDLWAPRIPKGIGQVGRVYAFPFLPLGLFDRMMSSLLHIPSIELECAWRSGILLRDGSLQALIELNRKAARLSIRIRFPAGRRKFSPNKLIRWTVDCVDTIVEGAYGVGCTINRLIPCTHCYALNTDRVFHFTYAECVNAIASGVRVLFCQHIRSKTRAVFVRDVAPDLAFGDVRVLRSDALRLDEKPLGEGGYVPHASVFIVRNGVALALVWCTRARSGICQWL